MTCGDIFLGLLAIIFPPIAVWIKSGICSADSFINILLCVLGYIPGLIHAWYIIAVHPEYDYDYEAINDEERGESHNHGHVTHYYVVGSGNPRHQYPPPQQHGYGTTGGDGQEVAPTVPENTRPQSRAQEGNGEGHASGNNTARPPPTYAEAVQGDHKIQTRD